MQAPSQGFLPRVEYPPPPRVHWFVLLVSWIALSIMFLVLAPPAYQGLLNSLVLNAWAFRFCLWIRSLDPETRSSFWCDVYVVVELSYALIGLHKNPSIPEQDIESVLRLGSLILGISTIYLIRSDLLKHYNQREPYGLELNGFMTYFFSFLYFQSQLYPIAQAKRREAEERSRSPISG